MAIAITHAGEGANTTGGSGTTSWSFAVGDSFAVYDYLIISIASDNAGTSGADSISGVSDAKGNSYSLIGSKNKSNAAAVNDSGTCKVYATQVTVALASTDNITVSQSPATNRGAAVIHKVTVASTSYLTFPTVVTDDGFSAGPSAWGFGTPAVGDGVLVSVAAEYNTTPGTIDTDSTGGPVWCSPSHSNFSNSGTTTSSQAIGTQHKGPITTSAAMSFTLNYAASCDWEAVAIIMREAAASTPGAPGAPSVSPNAVGQFGISWGAVGTPTGGRPVTNYYIQHSADNSNWTGVTNTSGTSINIGGYSPGQVVYFRIIAENAIGTGSPSGSTVGTAWNVPSQVTTLAASNSGSGNFGLTWTPPANNGTAITDYLVEWSYKGAASWNTWSHSALGAASSCTVTGLQSIYSYDFRVRAINAVGTASSVSNTATAEGKSREIWGGIDLSGRASL